MELLISIAVNVVLGILLLGLFAWKRNTDAIRLADPEEAMDVFRRYFPEAVGTATLAADRRAALIDLQPGGATGLLQRVGRRWNARLLVPREFSAVAVEPDGTIKLQFADFGWPRARLQIADPEARARWLVRLDSLTARAATRHRGDLRHA